MRLHFTETQLSSVGKLPFVQREGEYEDAQDAIRLVELQGFDKRCATSELDDIRELLRGELEWRVFRGHCLGVQRKRIHKALVPYAIKQKLGRVYHIKLNGLIDLMRILHCWRYHGVTMAGVDASLENYAITDEIPFDIFKAAVDKMWSDKPNGERIVFQNGEGNAVSIYNTQVSVTNNVRESVNESINMSAYETMCCHVITSMVAVPRSVALLGVAEDNCYVLDTTGRNGTDIGEIFTSLLFPRRYFSRLLRFKGEVTLLEDKLV